MKLLEAYRDAIGRCVKCGACRAHCPVFGAEKHEGRVARGKIALAAALLDGQVDLEPRFLVEMSQCILCGSCHAQCPNNVPTEAIVAAVRREISRKNGLKPFAGAMTALLQRPNALDVAARSCGALARLWGQTIPQQSGLRLRYPIPLLDASRTLPRPATVPFRQRHPHRIPGAPNRPSVLFFTGCGINYLYPQAGDALVRAMQALGIAVIIPSDQACCGMPAISAGASRAMDALGQANQIVFQRERYDAIVTACASCHAALTQTDLYTQGTGGEDVLPVVDGLTFMVQHGAIEMLAALPETSLRTRVTYHAPCHLRNYGRHDAPRAILNALPQVDCVEMAAADSCCGLGGTYSVHHYTTSQTIGAKKAACIAASGAQLVATDCPGCMVQLQDSLNHSNTPCNATHVLDLVAQAMEMSRRRMR